MCSSGDAVRRPYKRLPTVGTTLVPFGDNMVVQGNEQGICPDLIASQFVESSRWNPPEVSNSLPTRLALPHSARLDCNDRHLKLQTHNLQIRAKYPH